MWTVLWGYPAKKLVFKKMEVFYIIKSIFSEHREQMH